MAKENLAARRPPFSSAAWGASLKARRNSPTPLRVQEFLTDDRPDAYERLIDRLLASPRYGERWGRHWLDIVHYGETHGYDKDHRRDNAWPYRDYVISSFNDDMPYARFVREQVAGDILNPDDPNGIIATNTACAPHRRPCRHRRRPGSATALPRVTRSVWPAGSVDSLSKWAVQPPRLAITS